MNILLVTSVWSGANPIFFRGADDSSGMPAFNKMLQKLATSKDINLVVLLLCNEKEYNLELNTASWLNGIKVIKFYWNRDSLFNNFLSFYHLFKTTNKILKQEKSNFVYLHGVLGFPSYVSARLNKVDVGQRVYGTFLRDRILEKGIIKTFVSSPFESAAFKFKKKFLIVTDDGTHGDQVVNLFNKNTRPYNFYFLQNGVNVDKKNSYDLKSKNKYIFYPARITPWKRQDLAIDLLNGLENKDIKLYFAGKIIDQNYFDALKKKISKLNLNSRVIFLGELKHKETEEFMSKALAVAAFYDVSCKGNVALEAIGSECLMVSYKNRGLDALISDNYSGILGADIKDCIAKLNNLLNDEASYMSIKSNLKNNNKILSWEERLKLEINILMDKVEI